MGGASPQNCTMVNLPAPVDDGLLRVQNMPFSSEVNTRYEDSSWDASGVTASLDPSHFLPLNRVLAIYGGLNCHETIKDFTAKTTYIPTPYMPLLVGSGGEVGRVTLA